MEHEELATTTTTTSSSSSSSTSTSTSTPTSQAQVLRIALSIIEKAPRKRHSIASSPKQLWTIQEDTLLLEAVKKHGLEAWPSVAEKLPGRVAKQCRDRYRNHLCPKVKKGSWTAEEDAILFQYQKLYGNLWAEIAKHLPGRTDLSVKNRFYSKARKYDRHLKRLARESPVIRAAKQTPQSQPPSPQMPASTMRSPEFAACNLTDRANKKRKIEPSAKMAILSALQHASSVVPKREPTQTAPTSSMLLGTSAPSPLTPAPHASPTAHPWRCQAEEAASDPSLHQHVARVARAAEAAFAEALGGVRGLPCSAILQMADVEIAATAANFVEEACGADEDPSRLQQLEVIFTDTSASQHFEELKNVQKITLIDTRLERVPNLRCLGATLRSLTLSKQPGVRKLEHLDALPNLTELSVTRCGISKIENLERCPRLRRLWLAENRIERLENLENLTDLRELCVQGNLIRELGGLAGNMYLRVLDLSRNRVSRLKELERLSVLPQLRNLKMQSALFGACPVVYQENYRSFAICVLKTLHELDDEHVEDNDRARAEDTFLQRQLDFHDKVDELQRQHKDELRTIELARLKSVREAEDLKAQLLGQFAKLQEVVTKGREKVHAERMRQLRLRDQNFEHLKSELLKARKQHRELLEALIEEERATIEQEEKAFAQLSRRARLELHESVAMAEVMQGVTDDSGAVVKRVAVQMLYGDATSMPASTSVPPELNALAATIAEAQQNEESPGQTRELDERSESDTDEITGSKADTSQSMLVRLRIYRAVKIFNATLWRELWARKDPATASIVYVGVPDLLTLKRALTHGLGALGSHIYFSPNPRVAARQTGVAAEMTGLYRVLQCAFYHEQDLENLPESSPLDTSSDALELADHQPVVRASASLFVASRQCADLFAPRVYLVLSSIKRADEQEPVSTLARDPGLENLVQSIRAKFTKAAFGVPSWVEEKLAKIEQRTQTILTQYDDRVFNQLDPDTALQIEAIDERAADLHQQVINVRADIDLQKHKQERILQSSV
ncbi:Transcription factor MYB98 [Hondaea fermentalgiana]|uniref:Transcription factor MYB98 n=1 Tax=Hondaea fermentalgiana TaxID=2315210 RepID=A0A2R5G9K9_9STRA|nr:Transcription factor MYB98 [Hondaea fermentalgiana]|eukprot:GBG24751.1 Transcription factor MYB98 [Hondaea fermentalgiana]